MKCFSNNASLHRSICLGFNGSSDPLIYHAPDYLNQFIRSDGLLINLNQGTIKKKGSNQALDGQDGLKMGLKFEVKYAEFIGIQISPLMGPIGHLTNQKYPIDPNGPPIMNCTLVDLGLLKLDPKPNTTSTKLIAHG